jgi:hypothetical protein
MRVIVLRFYFFSYPRVKKKGILLICLPTYLSATKVKDFFSCRSFNENHSKSNNKGAALHVVHRQIQICNPKKMLTQLVIAPWSVSPQTTNLSTPPFIIFGL